MGLLAVLLQRDDPWNVRILAKVFWGAHPAGLDGIPPDDPGISVMHHFLGSWKVCASPLVSLQLVPCSLESLGCTLIWGFNKRCLAARFLQSPAVLAQSRLAAARKQYDREQQWMPNTHAACLGCWQVRGGWRKRSTGFKSLLVKVWTLYKARFARRGGLFQQSRSVHSSL